MRYFYVTTSKQVTRRCGVPDFAEEAFLDHLQSDIKFPKPHIWGIPKMSKGQVPGFKHSVTKEQIAASIASHPAVTNAVYV